ncbi:MAG: hypothetical protein JSV56_08120 [Methanomassiliicoccales archaeon]|nr:MAG: hypothetical protein JSV56_08120 [Methanomassiliicoccales archaeon]
MANLGYKSVKRVMKAHTNRPISKEAIQRMLQNIESMIEEGTMLAEHLLCEENSFRKAQGLRENVRLSKRHVTLAFDKLVQWERNKGD